MFGVLAGFAAAIGLTVILNAVLPPFQLEGDDTDREYIPVALGYLTRVATAVIGFVGGLRLIRRRRSQVVGRRVPIGRACRLATLSQPANECPQAQ